MQKAKVVGIIGRGRVRGACSCSCKSVIRESWCVTRGRKPWACDVFVFVRMNVEVVPFDRAQGKLAVRSAAPRLVKRGAATGIRSGVGGEEAGFELVN